MPAKKKPVKRKPMTAAAKRKAALVRAENRNALKFETFCQQYVFTQNGTQSYLTAYDPKGTRIKAPSAATESYKLLRKPETLQRIKELRIHGHEHLMISFEETLQEVAGLAQFDPANMFDETGKLLQLHEMDPVTRKMVNEIELLQGNDDESLGITKIKYGKDKKGYLDMIMKFYNAYSEHQAAGTGVIVVQQYCAQDANL
jgi:hypothetical protein